MSCGRKIILRQDNVIRTWVGGLWFPLFEEVEYEGGTVLQVTGWVGGTGEPPAFYIGWYWGQSGYAQNIEDARIIYGGVAPIKLGTPNLSTGTITSNAIQLNWGAVANAALYQIERATNSTFTQGLTTVYTGGSLTYTDTTLASSTTYYYRIKATNPPAFLDSNYGLVNATTGNTGTLSAPSLAASNVTLTSIQLNWGTVPNAQTYELQRALNPGFTSGLTTIYTGNANLYNNTGLQPETTYYYRVKAIADGYNDSAFTVISQKTSDPVVPTLAAPTLSVSNVMQTSMSLLWNNIPNATGYQLQRALDAGFTNGLETLYTGAGISFNDTGLIADTTYFYRIKATAPGYNDSAYTTISQKTNSSVTPTLTAPTLAASNVLETSIQLNWGAVPNAASYTLERALDINFTTGATNVYTGSNLTFTNSGLTGDTTYYYRIKATAPGYNDSPYTAISQKTNNPATPTLATPTLALGAITETSILLSWDAIPNATSYELQRSLSPSFASGVSTVYTGGQLLYNNTGLNANTTYYYRLKAKAVGYNDSLYSTISETTDMPSTYQLTITVNGLPGTPDVFVNGVQQVGTVITFPAGTEIETLVVSAEGYSIEPAIIETIIMDRDRTMVFEATSLLPMYTITLNVTGVTVYNVLIDGIVQPTGVPLQFQEGTVIGVLTLARSGYSFTPLQVTDIVMDEDKVFNFSATAIKISTPSFTIESISTNEVYLSWVEDVNAGNGYTAERALNAGFTTGLTTVYSGPDSSFRDQTVEANTTYYYRVKGLAIPPYAESEFGYINVTTPAAGTVTPDPATNPTTNDIDNTFHWDYNPLFPNLSQWEQTINGGATWTDLVAKPLQVGNIAIPKGTVGVRVKGDGGSQNPSLPLYNNVAYTVNTQGLIDGFTYMNVLDGIQREDQGGAAGLIQLPGSPNQYMGTVHRIDYMTYMRLPVGGEIADKLIAKEAGGFVCKGFWPTQEDWNVNGYGSIEVGWDTIYGEGLESGGFTTFRHMVDAELQIPSAAGFIITVRETASRMAFYHSLDGITRTFIYSMTLTPQDALVPFLYIGGYQWDMGYHSYPQFKNCFHSINDTFPPTISVTGIEGNYTITASSDFGSSAILVSINGAAYIQYTDPIQPGNVTRPQGYYMFKVKADVERAESVAVPSPAITNSPEEEGISDLVFTQFVEVTYDPGTKTYMLPAEGNGAAFGAGNSLPVGGSAAIYFPGTSRAFKIGFNNTDTNVYKDDMTVSVEISGYMNEMLFMDSTGTIEQTYPRAVDATDYRIVCRMNGTDRQWRVESSVDDWTTFDIVFTFPLIANNLRLYPIISGSNTIACVTSDLVFEMYTSQNI